MPNPTQPKGAKEEAVEALAAVAVIPPGQPNHHPVLWEAECRRSRKALEAALPALEQHFIERLESPEAVEAAQRAISSRSLTYIAPRLMTKALQAAASTIRGGRMPSPEQGVSRFRHDWEAMELMPDGEYVRFADYQAERQRREAAEAKLQAVHELLKTAALLQSALKDSAA